MKTAFVTSTQSLRFSHMLASFHSLLSFELSRHTFETYTALRHILWREEFSHAYMSLQKKLGTWHGLPGLSVPLYIKHWCICKGIQSTLLVLHGALKSWAATICVDYWEFLYNIKIIIFKSTKRVTHIALHIHTSMNPPGGRRGHYLIQP